LDVKGVFVEIGLIPNSDLAKNVVHFNEFGEIEVNCMCETDVPGLFAAGDVTNIPEKQIIIAAGEGADPDINFKLRLTLDRARASNMPKDNIDRAIRRGTGEDKAGTIIEEVFYERITYTMGNS